LERAGAPLSRSSSRSSSAVSGARLWAGRLGARRRACLPRSSPNSSISGFEAPSSTFGGFDEAGLRVDEPPRTALCGRVILRRRI
jgi:hypothetical protein